MYNDKKWMRILFFVTLFFTNGAVLIGTVNAGETENLLKILFLTNIYFVLVVPAIPIARILYHILSKRDPETENLYVMATIGDDFFFIFLIIAWALLGVILTSIFAWMGIL